MSELVNLDLDVSRPEGTEVARVTVAVACSYVRESGAPTLTEDCAGYEAFEREVGRLRAELDMILEKAADHFGQAARNAAPDAADAPDAQAPRRTREPRVEAGLTVADVMTRDVRTLAPNDKLAAADELMKVGRFRHVVVVDDEGVVVGVVSHRDIFFNALAWTLGQGRVGHDKALASVAVKEVMHGSVVTVRPEQLLSEAGTAMMERKVGCVPVVEDERLVGLLTEGDFLALLTG
jgi:CBS domain-containing membrane protein